MTYPNLFQVSNPLTFLSLEEFISNQLKRLKNEKRLLDNTVFNYEIAREDLTRDMHGHIEQIYRTLELPGFENFKPRLREYLAGISEYQKNKYHSLSPTLQKQAVQAWKRNFEAWGYPV